PFQDKPTLAAVERFWDDFEPDYEVYDGENPLLRTQDRFVRRAPRANAN
ncbi:hypothetical protein LCGC14_2596210, partial [marine sediment metagenome]